MIYVFDDIEEMQTCCGCPISADGMQTLSTINNLTSNFGVNKGDLSAGVIKLLSARLNFAPGRDPAAARGVLHRHDGWLLRPHRRRPELGGKGHRLAGTARLDDARRGERTECAAVWPAERQFGRRVPPCAARSHGTGEPAGAMRETVGQQFGRWHLQLRRPAGFDQRAADSYAYAYAYAHCNTDRDPD